MVAFFSVTIVFFFLGPLCFRRQYLFTLASRSTMQERRAPFSLDPSFTLFGFS